MKQRQKPLPREIIVYIGILGKEKKNKTISSGFENKKPHDFGCEKSPK
ncbi:MAG: hypothetical protein VZR31_05175 [Lachnospiraceae bacterium]|nr:hypothetical protein [Lachnospiraceae bacterium]